MNDNSTIALTREIAGHPDPQRRAGYASRRRDRRNHAGARGSYTVYVSDRADFSESRRRMPTRLDWTRPSVR